MGSTLWKGLLRHGLTAVTSTIAADGWVTEDMLQSGIGAVMTLVNIGWFVWDRIKERRAAR